jgi:hypothetical protein
VGEGADEVIDKKLIARILPIGTRVDHARIVEREIETLRVWRKHLHKHDYEKRRIADEKEVRAARNALGRAVSHLQKEGVQIYLQVVACERDASGRPTVKRMRRKDGSYGDVLLTQMEELLVRMNAVKELRVERVKSAPVWHIYVRRLQALYKLISGRRPTMNQKGGVPTPAAKFVADALRLAGFPAADRSVSDYRPRRPRKN